MTSEKDCCFTSESEWFRYRAAAIIIEDGCVLMAGNEKADYLYSVGGGVHMGESSETAVLREVFEETGVHYEIDRLAFIHENFFPGDGSFDGFTCHEVALYYLMKPKGSREIHCESVCADGKEFMEWVPLDEMGKRKAFPAFFKEKLMNIPETVEHIITYEI